MRLLITCAFAATALWSATAAQADELKVAYLPCGNVNDKSWTQVGYEGLLDAQKELAKLGTTMKLDYTESQPASKVEAAARDYASRGYGIIVLHCGTFADAAENTARAFPKTTVLYVTAPSNTNWPPNFWYYDIAQQEVQFAAGVLAALTTKSGRVATVVSFDFPAMSRQVEGFILGVRYANDKVKYSRSVINTWDDAAKAKEAALAAIDAGSDVILADTDQAARGIFWRRRMQTFMWSRPTPTRQASHQKRFWAASSTITAHWSNRWLSTPPAANSKKVKRITWVLPMASAAGRPIPPFRTAFPPRPGRSSRASWMT